MVSEQVVLRESHLGYHETTGKLLKRDPKRHEETPEKGKDSFWNQLYEFSLHGSLMGCSIQPDPKAKNAAKVEAKVGFGLHQRHAYSITGVYEVEWVETKAETEGAKNQRNKGIPACKQFYIDLQNVYNEYKDEIELDEDDKNFKFKSLEDTRKFVLGIDSPHPDKNTNAKGYTYKKFYKPPNDEGYWVLTPDGQKRMRHIQWLVKLKDTDKGNDFKNIESWYETEWEENEMYEKYKQPKGEKGILRFVACRNPWGRGEWTGPWGDESIPLFFRDAMQSTRLKKWEELKELDGSNWSEQDILDMDEQVNISLGTDDGIFHMEYEDWKRNFTIIFRCLDFSNYGDPESPFWNENTYHGMRIKGEWSPDTTGGGIQLRTWRLNPKYEINVEKDTKLFISLSQADGRLVYGKDYRQSTHPIAFHIIWKGDEDDLTAESLPPPYHKGSRKEKKVDFRKMKIQTSSQMETQDLQALDDQAMYKFNHATSCWCVLKKGKYIIVPSTYKRATKEELQEGAGPFHLSVIGCANTGTSEKDSTWNLLGGEHVALSDDAIVDPKDGAIPRAPATLEGQLEKDAKLKKDILYENVREKIIELSKKRGIHISTLLNMFKPVQDEKTSETMRMKTDDAVVEDDIDVPSLTPKEFKNKLLELGFLNSDITTEGPNNDFGVLAGEDNLLSQHEFFVMFEQHLEDEAMYEREKVPKPEDDLVYVAPPTETPGNLFINVVEARDLSLPTGWMSGQGKAKKTIRNSRLINIAAPSGNDATQNASVNFHNACILSAHLERFKRDEGVNVASSADDENTKTPEDGAEKVETPDVLKRLNDHGWKLTLYLDRPITVRQKVLVDGPKSEAELRTEAGGDEEKLRQLQDAEEQRIKELREGEEKTFLVTINDCHALVDGNYPFEIEETDTPEDDTQDAQRYLPYVTNGAKNYKWRNGDFGITTKAPELKVLKDDKGEALKHNKNVMYMYWEDDGLKIAEQAKKTAEMAKHNKQEDEDKKDGDAESKEHVTEKVIDNLESPRRTFLPYEDYNEDDENYNFPACWREVPINADTWMNKFKEIETEMQYLKEQKEDKKKGQRPKYEYKTKWVTKMVVKIPTHDALQKIQDIQGDDDDEINKFRRPHSALGDATKPIEWNKYELSIPEQIQKMKESEETEHATKPSATGNVNAQTKMIKEEDVEKAVWVLDGGVVHLKHNTANSSETPDEQVDDLSGTTLGIKSDGNENPQDNDEDEYEEKNDISKPLDNYLDKRHKSKKYKDLDKNRINKFKKWVKQKQRNKYMQRDDEAKHEMRYIDVIKVSAGKSGSGGKAELLSGEHYQSKTRHNFGEDNTKVLVSSKIRKKAKTDFDSSIYHQLATYVETVVLTRVFTVIDIIEKVHLGSRKANEISKLHLTTSREDRSDFVPVWQRCMRIAGLEKVLSAKDRESQNMMKWFNRFDSNKSGTIDVMEFTAALKTMGFKLHKKEIKTLMERFDREGDGEIDYKEFAVWLKSNEDAIVKRRSLHEILQIMQKIYQGSIRDSSLRTEIDSKSESENVSEETKTSIDQEPIHWPLSNDQGALSQLRSIFKNGVTSKISKLRSNNALESEIEQWEDLLEQPLTLDEFKRVVSVFELKYTGESGLNMETTEEVFKRVLEGDINEGDENNEKIILKNTSGTEVAQQKHVYVAEWGMAEHVYRKPSLAIKSRKTLENQGADDPLNLNATRKLAKQALEALASVAGQVEDAVDVTQAFSKFKVTRINDFCIVLMSDFVERLHEQMYSICDSKNATATTAKDQIEEKEEEKEEESAKGGESEGGGETTDTKKSGSVDSDEDEAAKALAAFKVNANDKLPALIKLKMLLDDLNIQNEVACSDLARLMKGDSVQHIEEKLRYLLRRKSNNADGVTYWLVTLGVDRARKNIVAIARDPESQKELKLVIEEDTSYMPILADLLPDSKFAKISSPKRLKKGNRGGTSSSKYTSYISHCDKLLSDSREELRARYNMDKMCPVFVAALQPSEERACRKLANRLMIARDSVTGNIELKLGESETFVQALQDAFAENSFDFFINATTEALTFRVEDEESDEEDDVPDSVTKGSKSKFHDVKVDKSDAPDSLVKRRKRVLDAIRKKQRLRAYLSGTSSVLKVVFQSSDGATNESMDWTTFVSHLENLKNPYVSVEMLPKHEENPESNDVKNFYQRTKADKDGGSQPWFNATFEVPYCPTTNALPIKHTDVMHLGFGTPKSVWREKQQSSKRKLHANEISQKMLFLLTVQAIHYEPLKTDTCIDYFNKWCRSSYFEYQGRSCSTNSLPDKIKSIIYENICNTKGHGKEALEFWSATNLYENPNAKGEKDRYLQFQLVDGGVGDDGIETVVDDETTTDQKSKSSNSTTSKEESPNTMQNQKKRKDETFEVIKLDNEELLKDNTKTIRFRMIPYILRNREKVVRSGSARVIMKDPRYVVVSVRRDPKSGMLFGTAYDSRSANEYEVVGPDGWQKNWNFDDANVSSQEANPPFLTGNKVREEKSKNGDTWKKWGYEDEKRWQSFVHGKSTKNIGDIETYGTYQGNVLLNSEIKEMQKNGTQADASEKDVFAYVDELQSNLWERLKCSVLHLGKEITPRLMLTAFTTPLSNMKGAGGDQYIGDCEIPVSLISSLGHDVGNKWFPIYRNDSYEQVAAPEKTGEIRIMYTFSTSKKHIDFAMGDAKKKNASKVSSTKKPSKNIVAANNFSDEMKTKLLKQLKAANDRNAEAEKEIAKLKKVPSRSAAPVTNSKNTDDKVLKAKQKEIEQERKEKERAKLEREEAKKEAEKLKKQLQETLNKLKRANDNKAAINLSGNGKQMQEEYSKQLKEKEDAHNAQLKEKEEMAKKASEDAKKLKKENEEKERKLSELMQKLKRSEEERIKLADRSNAQVVQSPSQTMMKSNEIRGGINTPTRPQVGRENQPVVNVSPRRSINKRTLEKQAAIRRQLAEQSIREKMESEEEWEIYQSTLKQALGTIGKQIIVRNPNNKERSLQQLEKFLRINAGDDDQLDIKEFSASLRDFNVSLNEDHIKLVLLHFDYDKNKTVNVSEVMKGIRDSLIAWGDRSNSSQKLGLETGTEDDSGLGPLPPWITKVKSSKGRYYYKNHNTRTTSWTDPRLGAVAGGGLNAVRNKRG